MLLGANILRIAVILEFKLDRILGSYCTGDIPRIDLHGPCHSLWQPVRDLTDICGLQILCDVVVMFLPLKHDA